MRTLLVVTVFLLGCDRPTHTFNVDSALLPYVEEFRAEALAQRSTVSIDELDMHFANTSGFGPGVVGRCEHGLVPQVTIDPVWWSIATPNNRENIVFHELGHCILMRDHDYAMLAPGVPASIMYPVVIPDSIYASHHTYYMYELFADAPR